MYGRPLLGGRPVARGRHTADEFWDRYTIGSAGCVSSTVPGIIDVVVAMAQEAIERRPAGRTGLAVARWAVALEADSSVGNERFARIEGNLRRLFFAAIRRCAGMAVEAVDRSMSNVAKLGVREPDRMHRHGFDGVRLGVIYR